jgi:hypothetical protein
MAATSITYSLCLGQSTCAELTGEQMKANGMRVFITGTSGFVGGALTRRLAQDGAEIHALFRRRQTAAN